MIRETIASALKSDVWTIKDAAEELSVSPDDLADACRTKDNDLVAMLEDVCELLDLKLMRVFTKESWDLYLEEAWASWGSKELSLIYAASKAEEWEEYSSGELSDGNKEESFEVWSRDFDQKEFSTWEATALIEFEQSERERLEEHSWVRWDQANHS